MNINISSPLSMTIHDICISIKKKETLDAFKNYKVEVKKTIR